MPQGIEYPSSSQVSVLSLLLNSELLRWLVTSIVQLWHSSRFKGAYKVENYDLTLELKDRHGKKAMYTKRQRVEFLQNGVAAILDQTWADGEVFAEYRCSPGIAVDRYREGFRWKVLISLRSTKNKGDTEEFLIEHTIKNGFTLPSEYFQIMIDHPTKTFTVSVIFPRSRYPKHVEVVEENMKTTHILGTEHRILLSNERVQYSWSGAKPRLYEGYILQWEW